MPVRFCRGVAAAAEWEHAADQRDGHLLQRDLRRGLWADDAAVRVRRGCLTGKVKHDGGRRIVPDCELELGHGTCVELRVIARCMSIYMLCTYAQPMLEVDLQCRAVREVVCDGSDAPYQVESQVVYWTSPRMMHSQLPAGGREGDQSRGSRTWKGGLQTVGV